MQYNSELTLIIEIEAIPAKIDSRYNANNYQSTPKEPNMKKLLITLLALTCYFGTPLNAMNTSNQVARRSHLWQGMPEVIHQSIFEFLTDKELVSKLATLSKDDLSEINKYFARIYPDNFFERIYPLFYPVINPGIDWQHTTYDRTPLTSLRKVAKLNTMPQPTDLKCLFSSTCLLALCELYPRNHVLQSLKNNTQENTHVYVEKARKLENDTTLTAFTRNKLEFELMALSTAHDSLQETIAFELFKIAHKDHNSFFIYYLNILLPSIFIEGTLSKSDLQILCSIIKALPFTSNISLRTIFSEQLSQWKDDNIDNFNLFAHHLSIFHLELLNQSFFRGINDPAARAELIEIIADCSCRGTRQD